MKYTKYQQGADITLEGLKHYLRIADNVHDAELADELKSATIFVQEYFNVALVSCSVLQEQPNAGKCFLLLLSDQYNIQVEDYNGVVLPFTRQGDFIVLPETKAVRISYDCQPVDVAQYAVIVYQIAAAYHDGQPEMVRQILKNYPVC